MSHRFAWLACAVIFWSAPACADSKAMEVLAQSKAAMGGSEWDHAHFIRTHAQVQTSGLAGPSESLEDTTSGSYVNTYTLGSFSGADGFDGKIVWNQDPSGQVATQGGDGARQGAVDTAYRTARAFWFSDRMSAEIDYEGPKVDGAQVFDIVRIVPKGGRPFDMWIDVKTHVIDRIIERAALDLDTTTFSDYRRVDGKLLPFSWRLTNGDARYDTVVKVDSVTFETSAPTQVFGPPPPPRRDFGFIGEQRSTTIPFKLINNHIYIEVKLNGQGPYEMLFDTGGGDAIMPTLAHSLGLKLEGAFQSRGTGDATLDVAATSVGRVEIGDAFLDRQTFASAALESFGNVEGVPFMGIVGYEIFKRFVVRTDYDAQQLTLIEPQGFDYRGSGVRVPFQLKDTIPIVPGDVDGVPGIFQLDTGSRMTLDLMSPFVAKNNLVARFDAKVQGVDGWGVGGAERSWIVRAHRFTFGGVSVKAPVVGLSQSAAGSEAEAYTAGNVGAGVFRKFNIVWDYPRNQIYFERSKHYAEEDVFNRAGLWANLDGERFVVIDVYAGSPASEAGLQAGDRILAVDGRQAQQGITLPEFRARMREAPGTILVLDFERNGRRSRVALTLRDLV
jgi:outer membrane lipoprotein-sorting protein